MSNPMISTRTRIGRRVSQGSGGKRVTQRPRDTASVDEELRAHQSEQTAGCKLHTLDRCCRHAAAVGHGTRRDCDSTSDADTDIGHDHAAADTGAGGDSGSAKM
jgi:hypothetical protein